MELSRDRRIVLSVILWLVRMASCPIRRVVLVKIVSTEIVCSSGSKVAITPLVRFAGILSIMVDWLSRLALYRMER